MKKMFVVLVCVAFLGGCATFGWKPSEDDLVTYENRLMAANAAELGIFIVFDGLCASKVLNETQCVAGYAADNEWDNAYTLAMGAIADYRAGTSDEAMMKKYIAAATASSIRIINLIKSILASKPSTEQARSKASKLKPPLPPPVKK